MLLLEIFKIKNKSTRNNTKKDLYATLSIFIFFSFPFLFYRINILTFHLRHIHRHVVATNLSLRAYMQTYMYIME